MNRARGGEQPAPTDSGVRSSCALWLIVFGGASVLAPGLGVDASVVGLEPLYMVIRAHDIDGGFCGVEVTTVVDMTREPPSVTRVGKGDPSLFGE